MFRCMESDVLSPFPLFVSMAGKKIIIYGGGTVAERRTAALLKFGAKIQLFAPEIKETVRRLQVNYPESLKLYEQSYKRGIPEADYVLSATNHREVDQAIYEECKERKIPVNIASDQSLCDFYFPALAEWENVVIGISSNGKNHRKVKWMAEKIREYLRGV